MLLRSLSAENSRGQGLVLPLSDPTGFIVEDIEGLGPVKATLASSSFANLDGGQYHSSRREPRNIILKLGLDPDYGQQSVYDLRAQLYDYFMPKSKVTLFFSLFDKFANNVLLQDLDVQIEGRIESFEPSIFSNQPAVDVSIMCYDPDFVDPDLMVFEGETVADLTETVLTYDGSVETGTVFKITANRVIDEFTVYLKTPEETLKTLYFTRQLLLGESLEISSRQGNKYATLTSSGVETSVLYSITPQSGWLELSPGDNVIRVYASGEPVPFTMEYLNKYGGL